MFLKKKILSRLIKQTYKTRLIVARDENDWLYLAGSYWEASIKMEFIPKEIKGDLISLIGELPEQGERIEATKDGNQMEIGRLRVDAEEFDPARTLTITDAALITPEGVIERIMQDEDTGEIYLLNNVFIDMVSNEDVEENEGEYMVGKPCYLPHRGVLWKNNVCELRVGFRYTKNEKIMENLKGIDLTPEVPK